MPFGLSKSEKQSGDASDPAVDKSMEGSEDVATDKRAEEIKDGDTSLNDSPAAGDKAEEDAPYRRMKFRPTFLDEDGSREEKAAPPPATPPPTGDVFFVSVSRQDRTDIHHFGDADAVQTFVEGLLDEGVPQEEVIAFSGHKLALRVSHRPVVKLLSGQED